MISIIIPVYNEEIAIKKILETLPHREGLEVIVVDGGSSDKTIEFAKQYPVNPVRDFDLSYSKNGISNGVKVIQCRKNRAVQMNEGAKLAKGDILLFLHADCLLEKDSLEKITQALNNGYIGGCLLQRINSSRLIYRFIEVSGNIRAKLFKVFYGDQAIFVRRDIFFKLGGFDDVELFEDIIFSKRLKKIGKVYILNKKVYTSARRWQKQGIIKTTLMNWLLTIGFCLGISANKLRQIYFDIR